MHDEKLIFRLKLISKAMGAIVAALGFLVLVGWILDIDALKSGLPGLVTMKANTAIAFILAGLSLWLLERAQKDMPWRRVAQACALIAGLLGALNLAEYLFAVDLGIDQLLFADPQVAPVPPGRMAAAAALSFVVLGFGLLHLAGYPRQGASRAQILSIFTGLLSFLSLIGYAYSVQALYSFGPYSAMALHTALAVAFLSAGVLLARPDEGIMAIMTSETTGGVMARRLVPAVMLVPPLLGWATLAGQRAGLWDPGFAQSLFAVLNVVVFAVLVGLSASALYSIDLKRRRAEEALRQAHEHLERRVEERTAEVKKLNEELERRVVERTAELAASNKELESFAYSVSHDLRAPLRHIDGFSQALLEDYYDRLDDKGKQYLNFVRQAAQTMAQLIDDLLKLSRVTRAEITRERVDLGEMAQEICAALQSQQPKRQAEFVIQPGVFATGDSRLLRLLLENLIGNAWKFTSRRERAIIEFGATSGEGKTVYFVRDNGAGFDMAYVGKLFGAFQRLHSADEYPGTGIGLATAQRIVHRHRGRIWAEGEVDEGATFYFTLE